MSKQKFSLVKFFSNMEFSNAIKRGNIDAVKSLISKGADPALALKKGNYKMVEELITSTGVLNSFSGSKNLAYKIVNSNVSDMIGKKKAILDRICHEKDKRRADIGEKVKELGVILAMIALKNPGGKRQLSVFINDIDDDRYLYKYLPAILKASPITMLAVENYDVELVKILKAVNAIKVDDALKLCKVRLENKLSKKNKKTIIVIKNVLEEARKRGAQKEFKDAVWEEYYDKKVEKSEEKKEASFLSSEMFRTKDSDGVDLDHEPPQTMIHRNKKIPNPVADNKEEDDDVSSAYETSISFDARAGYKASTQDDDSDDELETSRSYMNSEEEELEEKLKDQRKKIIDKHKDESQYDESDSDDEDEDKENENREDSVSLSDSATPGSFYRGHHFDDEEDEEKASKPLSIRFHYNTEEDEEEEKVRDQKNKSNLQNDKPTKEQQKKIQQQINQQIKDNDLEIEVLKKIEKQNAAAEKKETKRRIAKPDLKYGGDDEDLSGIDWDEVNRTKESLHKETTGNTNSDRVYENSRNNDERDSDETIPSKSVAPKSKLFLGLSLSSILNSLSSLIKPKKPKTHSTPTEGKSVKSKGSDRNFSTN